MTALIIFLILSALLITGMPVSIALGLTVFAFLFGFTQIPMDSIALKLFTGIEKFEIMAIPFFILAGNFLTHGGVARRMIRFASAMVGHWYGGMGLAAVLACALFAAISGSSPATVMAVGSILIPAMVRQGYPPQFGVGSIATAGGLGILIPPSIVMVMYSVATSGMVVTGPEGEQVLSASIGTLFMAGVIPGLMLATMLGGTTVWKAWRNGYPRMPRATFGERWRAFRESVWGLMLIVIIMGGIYGGIFTPTEAAAVSAVYAFVIAVWVYKDIRLRDVPKVLLSSAAMAAMLLYIITNAVMFAFILTSEQIPQAMSAWIVDLGLGKIGFLLIVNVMLLMVGMVMEPSAIVLIMAPILYPVAVKLGVDPVHFGIMMVVNMEIGLCTPPVGLNLYVGSAISRLGLTEVSRATFPWLLTALTFLMLVTYIPEISLLLPRLLGMG
ncbi:TRAP transporter large permease [Paracoccus spongiarum]|uniref:TRAP transporter large permease protein n=1 Tax=Paracoccus spongiarum TaxID=3064387 RepID=A0ABT9J872_9RHOB|nr:TRAP transporter large permease subunit [Paracoccus sp. 2205BS29-5]MDP5305835.1 TRAP transporter large permease subunit [Paracoccus sp. 2205BS29-5]